MAEFFHHNQGGVLVDGLVDGHHHAHFHQGFDDFYAFDCHFVRQVGHGNGFGNQDFVYDRFGRRLESMLVRLEFQLFAFLAAAYAFLVTAACRITVAAAFAAFTFAVAALVIIVAVVTVVFFHAGGAGGFITGSRCFFRRPLWRFRRFNTALFGGFTFFGSLCFLLYLLPHGFAACLAFLFFLQQRLLMSAHGGGPACLFVTLRLFCRADYGLRHLRFDGRFFRFLGFGRFTLFGRSSFFGLRFLFGGMFRFARFLCSGFCLFGSFQLGRFRLRFSFFFRRFFSGSLIRFRFLCRGFFRFSPCSFRRGRLHFDFFRFGFGCFR